MDEQLGNSFLPKTNSLKCCYQLFWLWDKTRAAAWASSNSVSLDICDYLKWSALALILNIDQIPVKKNCRKANLCVYLGNRNKHLAVGNFSHITRRHRKQFGTVGINFQICNRKGVGYSKNLQQRQSLIHKAIWLNSLVI